MTTAQEPKARVYLDTTASMLMTTAAREALAYYYAQPWAGANPNSLHAYGREAFALFEESRKTLARAMGIKRPQELIFTSGGTESDNSALIGMALGAREKDKGRTTVLFSAIEHEAVERCAQPLRRLGFVVREIPVNGDGFVEVSALEGLVDRTVALVSVMAVNNEVGTVQPIAELARVAHAHGALFHTDAVQALGHIPFDVVELGVDSATITAHKLGGPVGIGALYLKGRTPFVPFMVGGGQELGKRSGTQDVAGAYAFAQAARDQVEHLEERSRLIAANRDLLYRLLCENPYIRPTVSPDRRAQTHPGMVCVLVDGVESETMILRLDKLGFCVAAGSACSSTSLEPSGILGAMGIPRQLAFGALRISFDERVSADELRAFASALVGIVNELKGVK